ncbi:cytochrome c oxidase subunit II (mitochondrion) [Lepeophtheirus salmonis]|uniref:Cytochrome c oxidase subunit 2 n=1 Tax=Lepeophtheirus salmonis TaxID=72036 RepID=Q4L1C0_LEPSM|nr:cytochrome c oxidase subunit II [Lepeophtheirus salmonis]AAT42058.1 cytochrome c oxidase subunit II [Lepeophtheirus salmonis]ABX59303.1 cytochrome c oxidase subunit II [Lepeophtheirus salmonis]CAB4070531.1 cytochrome c oxidase subunit II [Lepeophtheirus salmonis]CAF3048470.1 cytochrome c oxidase subunit II [Lepeophtheirus salmonis]CAG9585940.1 cytochrome c oxidase subunit II [Lepeophtheirus salmonis]
MPTWSQFSFQDASSPVMEEFILFHDVIMVCLGLILVSVGGMLGAVFVEGPYVGGLIDGEWLEWIWTALPGLVLFGVAMPSLSLLYMYDEMTNFDLGVKVNGYQWYWSYEMPLAEGLVLDCFMVPSSDTKLGQMRLLESDVALTLPIKSMLQLMVSSKDVLHAWAVPSLGVKMDAVPGRINTLSMYSFRPGLYFGQCSEICGAHHSFMPILLEMVSVDDFASWLKLVSEE